MYDHLIASMRNHVQPIIDVAEINQKAFQQLSSLQSTCMSECINAGFDQLAALSDTHNPRSGAEIQTQFFKDLEIKLATTAQQELKVMSEAQKSLATVFNQSYTLMTDLSFLKDFDEAMVPKNKGKS